ncbi:MAG TPA: phosphoribosyltransferase family protein [Thermoanaerobaculia bacterium]|nr:phosphoribosyltransferase family protein [Thermoanaerobaculia bacterium]
MSETRPVVRYSTEEIARRIVELGDAIRQDAGTSPILLIGILKGTTCFLPDLMRAIPGAVRFEFIDVIRDEADTTVAAAMEIDFLTHFDMRGKRVYLLKDVVSTGVIENYLIAQLRLREPVDLKLVALIDRPAQRTVEVGVHFRGFEGSEGTLVGYGLEHRGAWGNLPWLGEL